MESCGISPRLLKRTATSIFSILTQMKVIIPAGILGQCDHGTCDEGCKGLAASRSMFPAFSQLQPPLPIRPLAPPQLLQPELPEASLRSCFRKLQECTALSSFTLWEHMQILNPRNSAKVKP